MKQREGLGGVRTPLLFSPAVMLLNGRKSTLDSGYGGTGNELWNGKLGIQ